MEDKKDEIVLKKQLYDRKRNHDKQEISHLSEGMKTQNQLKVELNKKIADAKKQIQQLQKTIVQTEASRKEEVVKAEQRKRAEIIRKRGVEIPTYSSQSQAPNQILNQNDKRKNATSSPKPVA